MRKINTKIQGDGEYVKNLKNSNQKLFLHFLFYSEFYKLKD